MLSAQTHKTQVIVKSINLHGKRLGIKLHRGLYNGITLEHENEQNKKSRK